MLIVVLLPYHCDCYATGLRVLCHGDCDRYATPRDCYATGMRVLCHACASAMPRSRDRYATAS